MHQIISESTDIFKIGLYCTFERDTKLILENRQRITDIRSPYTGHIDDKALKNDYSVGHFPYGGISFRPRWIELNCSMFSGNPPLAGWKFIGFDKVDMYFYFGAYDYDGECYYRRDKFSDSEAYGHFIDLYLDAKSKADRFREVALMSVCGATGATYGMYVQPPPPPSPVYSHDEA